MSGAGDTVVAHALSLAAGADNALVAGMANAAAGVVVSKVGTVQASPAQVLDFLTASRSGGKVNGPLLDRKGVARLFSIWKAEGLQIGFANGRSDILNIGHLSQLVEAREHCARLVVGVNSEASVRRLTTRAGPSMARTRGLRCSLRSRWLMPWSSSMKIRH